MPKTYDRRICMVCQQPIVPYQVISGIPWRIEKNGVIQQLYGHYHCVREDIGADKALRAAELGILPVLSDALFTGDKRLKKYVELEESQTVRPLERVYEFLQS